MARKPGEKTTSMPFPKVSQVAMIDVPFPPPEPSKGTSGKLFDLVRKCPEGKATRAEFMSHRQGQCVRAAMRKHAKAAGRFLSSSHTVDGLSWFFWLEPKNTGTQQKAGSK